MNIVEKLRKSLRSQRVLAVLLVIVSASASIAILAGAYYDLSTPEQLLILFGAWGVLSGIYYWFDSFSLPPSEEIVRYLDRTYPFFEDSSSLYLQPPKNSLEELQLQKIEQSVKENRDEVQLPKKRLIRSALLSLALFVTALLSVNVISVSQDQPTGLVSDMEIASQGEITQGAFEEPAIRSITLSVSPPGYTGLETRTSGAETVSAEEMSDLSWEVETAGHVDTVELIFNDRETVVLDSSNGVFKGSIQVQHRQIYRVAASNPDTTVYTDYYGIDVVEDRPPRFRFSSPNQMRTLLTEQDRDQKVNVEILDDYGITDAALNVTLASGSGESVRFRQRRFQFDSVTGLGSERVRAEINLNADSLEMTPGDELYLTVTANDNHPDSQTGRSETYILVVEDTTRSQPVMAGNIVVDLMPEDFRSQRQIILDTEELVEEMAELDEEQFRQRSRRIGQDQEILMLEFGHYLGLEDESTESGGDFSVETGADDHDDHGAGQDGDGHDHDHEELDGEGQEVSQSSAASDIPDEFFHDHGSPEMNTLFAESPRALLRQALSEMFRASQYLQTDRPEEALPYEYRALEYLQEAQQSERRYVRRAGLEGIPIPVDEKRLTGSVDDFANPDASYQTERTLSPLLEAEKRIREGSGFTDEWVKELTQIIRQTEISEGDKLYLMNRLARLEDPDEREQVREEILIRLTELNRNRDRNPAPNRVPVLGSLGGSR